MSDSFAKRRKLDDAAAILTRPFKSPLRQRHGSSIEQPTPKVAGGGSLEASPGNNSNNLVTDSDKLAAGAEQDSSLSALRPTFNNSSPSQALIQPHAGGTTMHGPGTAIPDGASVSQLPKTNKEPIPGQSRKGGLVDDPKIAALHRQNRTLELRLRNLRADVDTLSQAAKIEASPRDDELRALIDKWRSASRAAAEELFAGAKDRVNRMGGVGAWRDAERSRRARQRVWEEEARAEAMAAEDSMDEEEDNPENGSEAENGEDYEQKRIQRWELRQQRQEQREAMEESSHTSDRYGAAGETNQAVEDAEGPGDEHDAFTMDMMLRTMQIDLDLIGWDKKAQRWVQ